jgi:predicted nucleic acid-binding protein
MIVVDANVIAYRFLEGEKTGLACLVQKRDNAWLVPLLWRHEFLNILATSARSGIIEKPEAVTMWNSALHALAHNERVVNFEKALSCAVDFHISAYDAQYVTLAQTLNCHCITEDARLRKAFPQSLLSMREFVELKG